MDTGFSSDLLPEVVDLSSEDGRAFAVMAEDGETLVALFPRDDLPGGDDEAFQNAFLFLAAPKMLEVIAAIASGQEGAAAVAQCQGVLDMFAQIGSGRPSEPSPVGRGGPAGQGGRRPGRGGRKPGGGASKNMDKNRNKV